MNKRVEVVAVSVFVALLVLSPGKGEAQEAAANPAEGSAAPADGESAEKDVTDRERDTYWGGRRDVSIVQKRLFAKDGKFELTAFVGAIPNDPFVTYVPVGARIGYFFVESVGAEISGSFSGSSFQLETPLAEYLRNNEEYQADVTLLNRQLYRINAVAMWSPFYGKFALLDSRLSNFDIYLVAGAGLLMTESPDVEDGRDIINQDPDVEGIVGAGMRFFVNDLVSLRVDYRQGIFQKAGGGVATPSEVSGGVSFFLGGN